ncbi:hypothetical protein J1N35_034319, partial [Gossypium stocksii]
MRIMEKCGWQFFYLHDDDVLTKVVKEFYAYLTSPDNAFIYVHDVLMLFDGNSINAKYGLSDSLNEHTQFVMFMTIEGLQQVLTD